MCVKYDAYALYQSIISGPAWIQIWFSLCARLSKHLTLLRCLLQIYSWFSIISSTSDEGVLKSFFDQMLPDIVHKSGFRNIQQIIWTIFFTSDDGNRSFCSLLKLYSVLQQKHSHPWPPLWPSTSKVSHIADHLERILMGIHSLYLINGISLSHNLFRQNLPGKNWFDSDRRRLQIPCHVQIIRPLIWRAEVCDTGLFLWWWKCSTNWDYEIIMDI